jgi:hypothetical protein
VPERKSFPPRTLFVLLGTVVAFSLGGAWILAYARWQEIDPQDPGKMLAEEILQTGRARVRGVVKRMRRSERRGEQDSSERE